MRHPPNTSRQFPLETVSLATRKSHIIAEFFVRFLRKPLCVTDFDTWLESNKKCGFGQNLGQNAQNEDRKAIHGQHTDNTVVLRCIANERECNQLGFDPGCYNQGSALSNLPHQQIDCAVSTEKR